MLSNNIMEDYGEQWHRWDTHCQTVLNKIEANKRIPVENKKLIRDFVIYLTARGSKSATIWRHVYCYGKLLDAFDTNVMILQATRDDVVRAMAKVEKLDIGDETKAKIKITLSSCSSITKVKTSIIQRK